METRGSVLVVEDEKGVRNFLVAALQTGWSRIVPVGSAAEALDCLGRGSFELALVDVCMPGMNGLELCRQIRKTPTASAMLLVLLTSLSSPEDVVQGIEAGADEFLSKPIEPQVLRARLDALLRLHTRGAGAPSGDFPTLLRHRITALTDQAKLPAREREVLDLHILGRSDEDIAVALGISKRTARFHASNLLEKLGADSRIDLLRLLL
jgi:DNA-binding NarL/FixJ family response regulator